MEERYYRDPSPIEPLTPEYDKNDVVPRVLNYTKQLREKMNGVDVRESLARTAEISSIVAKEAGVTAEEAIAITQSLLDGTFDDAELATEIERKLNELEANYAPDLNSLKTEVGNARGDESSLPDRLNSVDSQLAQTTDLINNIFVNVKNPPIPYVGAKGDKVSDDTQAIQALLNNFSRVYIPDGEYKINSSAFNSGLKPNSNQEIVFAPDAWIIASESNSISYRLIYITGVENVTLINPKIKGDRDYNTQTTGEHGMGIYISNNAKHITINNPITNDCYGDGIYIGGSVGAEPKNIKIKNTISDNNRRQGLSITCGENITIEDGVFSNTNGTAPQTGVDIEPNYDDAKIDNLVFINCIFEGNATSGLLFYNIKQRINATFNDCTLKGDNITFKECSFETNEQSDITFNNLRIIDSGINAIRFEGTTLPIKINGLTIINPNRSQTASNNGDALLFDASRTGSNRNIRIKDIKIVSDDGLRYPVSFYRDLESANENIHLEFERYEVLKGFYIPVSSNLINLNVSLPIKKRLVRYTGNLTDEQLRDLNYFYSIFTNKDVTYLLNHTVGSRSEFEGHELGLRVESNQTLKFTFENSNLNGSKRELSSSQIGSEVLIRYDGSKWIITKQIGDWTIS